MPDPTPVAEPIVVGSAAGEQVGQAARTLLTALGGYIVAKGWIPPELENALIPVVLIAGPLIWGQLRVLKTNAQRKTMAAALPDAVAVVK
jgi:hypothetical protein